MTDEAPVHLLIEQTDGLHKTRPWTAMARCGYSRRRYPADSLDAGRNGDGFTASHGRASCSACLAEDAPGWRLVFP